MPMLPWVLPMYELMREHLVMFMDDTEQPLSLREAACAGHEKLMHYYKIARESMHVIVATGALSLLLLHDSYSHLLTSLPPYPSHRLVSQTWCKWPCTCTDGIQVCVWEVCHKRDTTWRPANDLSWVWLRLGWRNPWICSSSPSLRTDTLKSQIAIWIHVMGC